MSKIVWGPGLPLEKTSSWLIHTNAVYQGLDLLLFFNFSTIMPLLPLLEQCVQVLNSPLIHCSNLHKFCLNQSSSNLGWAARPNISPRVLHDQPDIFTSDRPSIPGYEVSQYSHLPAWTLAQALKKLAISSHDVHPCTAGPTSKDLLDQIGPCSFWTVPLNNNWINAK